MAGLRVAVVCSDPEVRLAAARAFDGAPASWQVTLHHSPPEDADVVVYGPDAEGGGIAFDPARPQRVLQEVGVAAALALCRVVAVTSASGGTGATTIALHLARAAAGSRPTCLLDLDARWGARDRLGLGEEARTWAEATDAGETELCALPVAGGFRVLLSPGAAGARGERPDALRLLDELSRTWRYIVVDVPDGDSLPAVAAKADAVIVVMAPTLPAARRTARFLEALPARRYAIVTNRLGPGGATGRAGLERILGRPIALELPCAPGLRDAEDDDVLLDSAWSPWHRRIRRLVRDLDAATEERGA